MSVLKPYLRLVEVEPSEPAAGTELDQSSDAGLAGLAVGAVIICALLAMETVVLLVLV